jgi:hypothetical protein
MWTTKLPHQRSLAGGVGDRLVRIGYALVSPPPHSPLQKAADVDARVSLVPSSRQRRGMKCTKTKHCIAEGEIDEQS